MDILEITKFPTWEELPELDLYLDQVLLYVNAVTEVRSVAFAIGKDDQDMIPSVEGT